MKEAALDSPTFRATAVHFGEQIDLVEQWLQSYIKAASRLATEVSSIENIVNTYLSLTQPPATISEAVIDYDYTVLALRRYNDGAKEFWHTTLKWMKKVESQVVEPIKAFMGNDVSNLKVLRRTLDASQKSFDSAIARYAGQNKTKEASSLREDAFQLHEARKAYLKASMDFCMTAPQVRASLDKLLIKVFAERWKEMKNSRDVLSSSFQKWSTDIDRIRGWSKEMENNERIFKRELQMARKQIEEAAELTERPSRELDDYNTSTVPYLGASAAPPPPGSPRKQKTEKVEKAEKQGWLFQRTVTGKPSRTVWIRRWFYVKNGIFGWLIQGVRGVEESEKTGVLLCGVRPAFQEERRFCFEVKTKDSSIIVQAETQRELMDWIAAFEVAKRKALENPASTDAIAAGSKSVDAAFAVSPPVAPEFAAKSADTHETREESAIERSATLSVENPLPSRTSTDIGRRSVAVERDSDNPTTRLMQKLDIHRKSMAQGASGTSPVVGGGIASLIASSHNMLPLGMQMSSPVGFSPPPAVSTDLRALLGAHLPHSSLAPSTLAEPPATTNLSKAAVVITGERGLRLGSTSIEGGTPGGLMANVWGTNNWGYLNRLERGEIEPILERRRSSSQPPSPMKLVTSRNQSPTGQEAATTERSPSPGVTSSGSRHRKTISMTSETSRLWRTAPIEYPNDYPTSLKAQDAQFNMLIPQRSPDDRLVMVFRATWSANDQQEFPGRAYVTMKGIYLYSNRLGLVLTTGFSLASIEEVTAAPGKDCDFLFFHLKDDMRQDGATRVTVKVFLEPLKLLQRRLNYLIRNVESDQPVPLEDVIKTLIKMENGKGEDDDESPLDESWEDIAGETTKLGEPSRTGREFKASLRIDGALYPDLSKAKSVTKFRLPPHPVEYVPQGFSKPIVEKDFDVTAKALFHVLAGDKSAVFQILYCESCVEKLVQSPWVLSEQNGHHRREFKFQVAEGGRTKEVTDYQAIDVYNDHLCYVITNRKTPWFLPHSNDFSLLSKIVVTHLAKAKCKFAVYATTDWAKPSPFGATLIDSRAKYELEASASSLAEILSDQVSRLGSNGGNNSRRAVQVFGNIGQQTQASQLTVADLPPLPAVLKRRKLRPRSLPALLLSAARRSALAAFMSVLAIVLQVLAALQKIVTSHRVLVLVLVLSVITNLFFTQRDSWTWWRERSASKFLKRMGVGPNVVMGRSVWLRDLDEWTAATSSASIDNGTVLGLTSLDNSPCQQQFSSILSQTDPNSDVPTNVDPSVSSATRQTLARLQQSRQKFGTYRNDLLVALRVVDRVERDVLRGEWEKWVHGEANRCRQVRKVLKRERNNAADGLQRWWQEYCRSCLAEAASF